MAVPQTAATSSPASPQTSTRDAPLAAPRWDTFLAFLALCAADLLLLTGGYRWLHAAVRRWPIVRRPTPDGEVLIRVCKAIERATLYYPRSAMCLPRSAVTACLLRWRGIPAQMVIGSRALPFYAHAWVEVGDRIVNDSPKVRERYNELDRF